VSNHYEVSTVTEYEQNGEKKSRWTRVGVAFPLKNKDGFQLILEALPTNGKLVMLPPREKDGRGGGSGGGDIPFAPFPNI
jgi:hypothetical protein